MLKTKIYIFSAEWEAWASQYFEGFRGSRTDQAGFNLIGAQPTRKSLTASCAIIEAFRCVAVEFGAQRGAREWLHDDRQLCERSGSDSAVAAPARCEDHGAAHARPDPERASCCCRRIQVRTQRRTRDNLIPKENTAPLKVKLFFSLDTCWI